MVEIQIENSKPWKACATDGTRPVLEGLFVDPAGLTIASDGFIMAIVPIRILEGEIPNGGFIVPRLAFKDAKADVKGCYEVRIILDEESLRVETKKGNWHGDPIEGKYPDWRYQLPNKIIQEAPLPLLDSERVNKLVAALGGGSKGYQFAKRTDESSPVIFCHLQDSSGPPMALSGKFGIIMPVVAPLSRSEAHSEAEEMLKDLKGDRKVP